MTVPPFLLDYLTMGSRAYLFLLGTGLNSFYTRSGVSLEWFHKLVPVALRQSLSVASSCAFHIQKNENYGIILQSVVPDVSNTILKVYSHTEWRLYSNILPLTPKKNSGNSFYLFKCRTIGDILKYCSGQPNVGQNIFGHLRGLSVTRISYLGVDISTARRISYQVSRLIV